MEVLYPSDEPAIVFKQLIYSDQVQFGISSLKENTEYSLFIVIGNDDPFPNTRKLSEISTMSFKTKEVPSSRGVMVSLMLLMLVLLV